jgi:hypothetical protein
MPGEGEYKGEKMKARCIDCNQSFEVKRYHQGVEVANGGEWQAPEGHRFNLDPDAAEIDADGSAMILEESS